MTRNALPALVLILVLAIGFFIVKPGFCSVSDVRVGLFYYVWYTGEPGVGHWSGEPEWTVVDSPILGFYDSSDPKVIEQHLEWFEELGIDFLIVSWFGPKMLNGSSFNEDYATETLFRIIHENGYPIQVVLMVEDFGNYSLEAIQAYIYGKYASIYTNEYFKLDVKPLLCWWNSANVTGTYGSPNVTNIQTILSDSRFDARIVGHDDYVNWSAWRPHSLTLQDDWATPPIMSEDGFVCIEPRYDNIHIGGNKTFDEDYSLGLYDRQWNWTLENEADVRIVAVYSWNEYHERSQIEPHRNPDGEYVLMPFSKTYHYVMIPELQLLLILPLFFSASMLLAVIACRKHRWPSEK